MFPVRYTGYPVIPDMSYRFRDMRIPVYADGVAIDCE